MLNYIYIGIHLFLSMLFIFISYLFIASLYSSIKRGVPHVASFDDDIEALKDGLKRYELSGKSIIDMGSGTGKVLRFLSKNTPVRIEGYEIDFGNYLLSIIIKKIWKYNYNVYNKSYYEAELSKYEYIYVYLYPEIIDKVEEYIIKTAKKGTIVISNGFKFKKLEQIDVFEGKNGKEELFVYSVL